MTVSPTLALNDGCEIPQLGLGVWQTPAEDAGEVVRTAVATGYRLIDTAAIYGNERGVGEGVRAADVPREALFVTTKVWNDRQGRTDAMEACRRSLQRLGLDYVDLYLIHWPAPARDLYLETWKALIELREAGLARSIGVSNFTPEQLTRIIGETGETPSVNQIELHPRFQQKALRAFHQKHGIVTQSWSPLGQGRLLDERAIGAIARGHGKTPAQTILRWHLQLGLAAIPKSASVRRIAENLGVFDFRVRDDEMAAIAALDDAKGRMGPDPAVFS